MKKKFIGISACAAILAASLGLTSASTQAAEPYPNKPIEWIIMWSAGGGADTATRIFAKYFSKELGQKIIVRNVTGAGGTVGYRTGKAAKADGYTLVSALSDLPKYKPLGKPGIEVEDFDIIGSFAVEAPILVSKTGSDIKTLDDFVSKAKASPGDMTVGVSNLQGVHHQPVVLLAEKAGVDIPVISHGGSPQMNAALLGGHVDMISSWTKQSLSNVKSGDLKYVAYFGSKRLEAFPDVPTVKELGYDVVWEHSYGLSTPKGAPEEVKKVLLSALERVWATPQFEEDMKKVGLSLYKRGFEYKDELLATEKQMVHVVDLMNK